MLNLAASKTADVAGDGTTKETVLAQAMLRQGNKAITVGILEPAKVIAPPCNMMDLSLPPCGPAR